MTAFRGSFPGSAKIPGFCGTIVMAIGVVTVTLPSGEPITPELVRRIADEELERIEVQDGARAIFEQAALGEGFPEFFTLPAYERLP